MINNIIPAREIHQFQQEYLQQFSYPYLLYLQYHNLKINSYWYTNSCHNILTATSKFQLLEIRKIEQFLVKNSFRVNVKAMT